MRSLFHLPLFVFLFFSCSESTDSVVEQPSAPYDEVERAKVTFPDSVHYLIEKMIGTWVDSHDSLNHYVEYWHLKNDSVLEADSYDTEEGIIIWAEKIAIPFMQDTTWYVPQVPNQNEGKPVFFALESATNHEYVFVNHKHDWPQEIVYHLVHDDTLNITLGGPNPDDTTVWHEEYWFLFRDELAY